VSDAPEPGEDEPDEDAEEFVFVADADAARLDVFVAERMPELSRARVRGLIDDGLVTVGGAAAGKAGQKVRFGDEVVVRVPPPAPIDVEPEAIPLRVVFEDAHLIAIDKPPGMVVHPAPGHPSGTLVNALLAHCGESLRGIGGALRPGIVHRLDGGTSGVMVAAKDGPTHTALSAMFKSKQDVVREYIAIASPAPPHDAGTIRTLYNRHPVHRKKFSSKVANGKPAVTHWRVIERFADAGAAIVRCRLETGRTHQIRVHMADSGWALLGDPLYGKRRLEFGRQALHAERLDFTHPITGARLELRAPIPDDLARLIDELRAGAKT
jgi:23S rRNA pseudouridine1911/1915/1917 synthase